MERFNELCEEIDDDQIGSFNDLNEHYSMGVEALKHLAAMAQPLKMTGINIAFFGIISTGKSTMLNGFLGKPVAATGPGETTTQLRRYDGHGFSLYEVPGKSDEMSYFTKEYFAFWKQLTHRLVLITTTVKEMTSVFRLLDCINLKYYIVVNKFDQHQEDERETLKEEIRLGIKHLKLKGVNDVWFVSSKYPGMFPDWLKMINTLTEQRQQHQQHTRSAASAKLLSEFVFYVLIEGKSINNELTFKLSTIISFIYRTIFYTVKPLYCEHHRDFPISFR